MPNSWFVVDVNEFRQKKFLFLVSYIIYIRLSKTKSVYTCICTVLLVRFDHLSRGRIFSSPMVKKIKNPAPWRNRLSSWLLRHGAVFFIFSTMGPEKNPLWRPSLIVNFSYQISTYSTYNILARNYLFCLKKAFILTENTKTKKITKVIWILNIYRVPICIFCHWFEERFTLNCPSQDWIGSHQKKDLWYFFSFFLGIEIFSEYVFWKKKQ